MEFNLAEFVERCRSNENNYMHAAVVVLGDREAQKILAAWSTMPSSWRLPAGAPPENERVLWDWVCTGSVVNWNELAQRSGVAVAKVPKIFEVLRSNRLVYPDGTIAAFAAAVLKGEVMKSMKGLKR